MKHIFLIVMLAFAFFVCCIAFAGCSTENPICSTNFCAVGEVFPRSDLSDDQLFSEVDVDDSVIFATLIGGTPVVTVPVEPDRQTTPADSATLAGIVNDVSAGGTRYSNKIVTITGTIKSVFESGTRTLITNNEDVTFYVGNRTDPSLLDRYEKGRAYTLTLYIAGISAPSENFDWYSVWGKFPQDDTIHSVSMTQIANDVANERQTYLNKFVRFSATVEFDKLTYTTTDTISLLANREDVAFFVNNRYPPPNIMGNYKKGVSYTFTVFIHTINYSEKFDDYSVHSYIVLV